MFGRERSEASQHGPKMMMMMMGGGEDNVVIDGDINHGWTGGRKLRTARGQDLSLSSVSAVPAPSTGGQRKKRSQDPDPGSQMQDHSSDQQQGRIQEKKWPGSVTQLRVRWAEEVEEPGLRNEMDRSQTQAVGCRTICLTHCHCPAQSSHTREEVARP